LAVIASAGAAAALAGVALAWALGRARRGLSPARASPGGVGGAMKAAGSSLAICVGVLGGLRALGSAAQASVQRAPLGAYLGTVGAVVACTLLAAVAVVFLSSSSVRPRAVLATVAAIFLATGWSLDLDRTEAPRFDELFTLPPGEVRESSRFRPPVVYQVNEHGFRGPGWALAKAPGTARVALIGDSYVFGIGVEQQETLDVALKQRLLEHAGARSIEILNLGIPGDNITSHVDAFAAASRLLAPDAVVVCLTLPNDLSRWDWQAQRREGARPSAFSLGRFLLGAGAVPVWEYARLESRVTSRGIGHLGQELARLNRIRRALPAPPPVLLFTYGPPDPAVARELAAAEGTQLIAAGPLLPGDTIEGDGHPTGSGNRRFAAWIADALEAHAEIGRLFSGPPQQDQARSRTRPRPQEAATGTSSLVP
jgi:hypothetical protein